MNTTLFIPAIMTCFFAVGASATTPESVPSKSVGTRGMVGCLENPQLTSRLEISKPGLYENIRIDAGGRGGNIVKITADDVILRNCEIFNGTGNGIGVFGTRVLIENCRIHHLLAGSYEDQHDAHGITGRWGDITIRNCDISYTSGDSIQFDPDRQSHGSVIIEDCRLWTGPLEEDAPGFKAGQRPGENAVDTKVPPGGARSKLVIRNCHFHGWNQPSQIENMAALNLKENVDAEIIHCVFEDNEIALRLRGPGKNGGAPGDRRRLCHLRFTDRSEGGGQDRVSQNRWTCLRRRSGRAHSFCERSAGRRLFFHRRGRGSRSRHAAERRIFATLKRYAL